MGLFLSEVATDYQSACYINSCLLLLAQSVSLFLSRVQEFDESDERILGLVFVVKENVRKDHEDAICLEFLIEFYQQFQDLLVIAVVVEIFSLLFVIEAVHHHGNFPDDTFFQSEVEVLLLLLVF